MLSRLRTSPAMVVACVALVAALGGSAYAVTSTTTFNGTLSGGVVSGVLGFGVSGSGTITTGSIVQSYSATTTVSLR